MRSPEKLECILAGSSTTGKVRDDIFQRLAGLSRQGLVPAGELEPGAEVTVGDKHKPHMTRYLCGVHHCICNIGGGQSAGSGTNLLHLNVRSRPAPVLAVEVFQALRSEDSEGQIADMGADEEVHAYRHLPANACDIASTLAKLAPQILNGLRCRGLGLAASCGRRAGTLSALSLPVKSIGPARHAVIIRK